MLATAIATRRVPSGFDSSYFGSFETWLPVSDDYYKYDLVMGRNIGLSVSSMD